MNAGSLEALLWMHRMNVLAQERVPNTLRRMDLVEGIKGSAHVGDYGKAASRCPTAPAMTKDKSTGTAFPNWRIVSDQEP